MVEDRQNARRHESRGSWFKFYHEWSNDPKVQQLSEVDQRRMVMIMCMACRGERLDLGSIAYCLRLKPSKLRPTLGRLTAIGFLSDDGTIINWDRRQGPSEAQKKRQQRKAKRHVPGQSPPCPRHVPGQSPDSPRPDSDTDSDADADAERESPYPLSVGTKKFKDEPHRLTAHYLRTKHAAALAALATGYLAAMKRHGYPANLGGAWQARAGEYLLSHHDETPDGVDRIDAFLAALEAGPLNRERVEYVGGHFTLAWWLATVDGKGSPVDRLADVAEGTWTAAISTIPPSDDIDPGLALVRAANAKYRAQKEAKKCTTAQGPA